MSNIDKQALRERYSPQPAPECHICGKEMTIQRMSARRITYGCTGATYDDKGCHYAEGRSIADDHYEQSRVTVVDVSDPDVLALLDELEHYKSREERVTNLVLDNSTSWDALYKKLEAAEKLNAEQQRSLEHCKFLLLSAYEVQRDFAEALGCTGDNESIMEAIDDMKQRIAELEAKLETADRLQDSAFRDGLKAGFSYGQTDDQSGFTQCMSAYSPGAGIKVKGE
ncbi:TPA: ead/Ea22-like family protein [Salmonella enterica subsp. enterica serovar Birkenhead]